MYLGPVSPSSYWCRGQFLPPLFMTGWHYVVLDSISVHLLNKPLVYFQIFCLKHSLATLLYIFMCLCTYSDCHSVFELIMDESNKQLVSRQIFWVLHFFFVSLQCLPLITVRICLSYRKSFIYSRKFPQTLCSNFQFESVL